MSETLSYPSELFPAQPSLCIEKPTGWESLVAVGLPLALAKEVSGKEFRANVLVSIERKSRGFTLEQAYTALSTKLKKFPRYKLISKTDAKVLNSSGISFKLQMQGTPGQQLLQWVSLGVVDHGYVVDVVQATGVWDRNQPAVEEEIIEILSSLTLNSA